MQLVSLVYFSFNSAWVTSQKFRPVLVNLIIHWQCLGRRPANLPLTCWVRTSATRTQSHICWSGLCRRRWAAAPHLDQWPVSHQTEPLPKRRSWPATWRRTPQSLQSPDDTDERGGSLDIDRNMTWNLIYLCLGFCFVQIFDNVAFRFCWQCGKKRSNRRTKEFNDNDVKRCQWPLHSQ